MRKILFLLMITSLMFSCNKEKVNVEQQKKAMLANENEEKTIEEYLKSISVQRLQDAGKRYGEKACIRNDGSVGVRCSYEYRAKCLHDDACKGVSIELLDEFFGYSYFTYSTGPALSNDSFSSRLKDLGVFIYPSR